MNRWFAIIPLVALVALVAFAAIRLGDFTGRSLADGRSSEYRPDALVGQTVPETVLPMLTGATAGPGVLDLKTAGVGKPMWGAWWAWGDARLMSVLILFLFYLGYMALRASIDDETKAARAAAVLGLVGLINLPIVKFSVDWWNTLHQPASLLRAGGPAMPAEYLTPLLTMMAAWGLFFAAVWLTAIRTEIVRRRVLSIRARRALEA